MRAPPADTFPASLKLNRPVCPACSPVCQARRVACAVGCACWAVPGGLPLAAPPHPGQGLGPRCPPPSVSTLERRQMLPTPDLSLPPLELPWPPLSGDAEEMPQPWSVHPCWDARTELRAHPDRHPHARITCRMQPGTDPHAYSRSWRLRARLPRSALPHAGQTPQPAFQDSSRPNPILDVSNGQQAKLALCFVGLGAEPLPHRQVS